jgi:hypothetical protein
MIFALALAMQDAPTVEVKRLAPDRFQIILTGFDGDDRESQAAIAPVAAQLSAKRTPRYEQFRQNRTIAPGTGKKLEPARFEQDIACVAPAPSVAGPGTAPFTATAADEAAVRAAALAFLNARSAGRAEESREMLSAEMKATSPPAEWAKQVRDTRETLGESVAFRIVAVTWYVDPPGTAPGIYAAADFAGSSARAALVCGYVSMVRSDAGYRIVRIEFGSAPKEAVASATPEASAQIRQALRCRAE